MAGIGRYVRLMIALARYGLARELAFRGNFVAKVLVEILWLFILLAFYLTIFSYTNVVADWSAPQYFFFVGCYFALEGLVETLFLDNCNEFADLIRSGDLDFSLLKPIDEQFLLTCRKIDWSTAPNVIMGTVIMIVALVRMEWQPDLTKVLIFFVMFGCGLAISYSFLVLLTSMGVWLVRNQSLFELWWLFTSLMRYPREIFRGNFAYPLGFFFYFIVPVMLAVNVPANVLAKNLFDPWMCAYTAIVTVLLLVGSRLFFKYALRKYRSASS